MKMRKNHFSNVLHVFMHFCEIYSDWALIMKSINKGMSMWSDIIDNTSYDPNDPYADVRDFGLIIG